MTRSFATSQLAILHDPAQRKRLADVAVDQLPVIAERLIERDAYGSNVPTRRALEMIAQHDLPELAEHATHQLWCTWRECHRMLGSAVPLDVVVTDGHRADESVGSPTVVLTPMTLGASDAVDLLHGLAGDRPFIVYGERLPGDEPPWVQHAASPGLAGLAEIVGVLDQDGVFATFADFAYAGHRCETISLFGQDRPISSAYVGLVSRPGIRVLPVVCVRRGDIVEVVVGQPWIADPSAANRSMVIDQLAMELERLIVIAGHQWLLASTLTFDSPQSATVLGR